MSAPTITITTRSPGLSIGGDSNCPAVWVDGKLRVFNSHYPGQGGVPDGGHGEFNCFAPNIETPVTGGSTWVGGRNYLSTRPWASYGPWLEGIIQDTSTGHLYAYCHCELRNNPYYDLFHVGILAQKSTDGGLTWTDIGMGVVIDTPAGTDINEGESTAAGYGFRGGNGDCSAVLHDGYVYVFFGQYGRGAAEQGVGVARMAWADRDNPLGKFYKWKSGGWGQAGAGGTTDPVIPNVGDIHGLRTSVDYYWGPSIHYNTHLEMWVIVLNRSNDGSFAWSGGQTNYWSYSSDLVTWSTPQAFELPGGSLGGWYPLVIGMQDGVGTDKLCGETGRLFISGASGYRITFNRPPPPVFFGSRGKGQKRRHF